MCFRKLFIVRWLFASRKERQEAQRQICFYPLRNFALFA